MKTYPLILRKNGATVKVYRITQGDPNKGPSRTYYTYCWKGAHGRERESATIEDNALQRAQEILDDLCAGRADRIKVTAEKLAYYRACEEKLGNEPLMAAVDFYLAGNKPIATISPLALVDQFLIDKANQGASPRHISTLAHHLRRWVKTSESADAYLSAIPCLRTRRNHRISLVTFGKWAVTQNYWRENPFEKTTNPIVPPTDPGILTPDELRAVLAKADDCTKLFIALGAFGGLRASEITRLKWKDIQLAPVNLLVLSRDITKTKRRRTVHLQPNLHAWFCKYAGQKVGGDFHIVDCPNPHLGLRTAAKAAGVTWRHNCLRHSYISYRMALTRNAAAVAEECGNSEAVLQEAYKNNTSSQEAQVWFNINP